MTAAGPAWDLSSEYTSTHDPRVSEDLAGIDSAIESARLANTRLAPALASLADGPTDEAAVLAAARELHETLDRAGTLLSNLYTYAQCLLSVDGRDRDALALQSQLEGRQKSLTEAAQPLSQFLKLASDTLIAQYLDHPSTRASSWAVAHTRARRHELLSLSEETLVGALSMDGIHAWGKLYTQLSGTISCDVQVGNERQTLGLAATANLMSKPDDGLRRNAWLAINSAWKEHAESCAAALNAIAGWRLEMARKRSHRKPVHFLDAPLHDNAIGRATLDALLSVAAEAAPMARNAARLQARAYGKDHYGPWDNRAPAPVRPGAREEPMPFADGLALIADTFGGIDPELGDFVRMMGEKRWIEGTVGNAKRPGAYQTEFEKSRTPRIYMTYSGSQSDVITLAHELGHAYHSWVMRDLANDERSFGMSIAETASTFGEAIVREALLDRADSPEAAFGIAWQDAEAAVAFVLNIPTRFAFEKAFYERRAAGPLRVDEFEALMSDAWRTTYGDVLAEPDPLFWASKLHFFISGVSFYNFPYLFGYLFSLGVYAQRAKLGSDFYPAYKALLRDTGRMSAEELASRHLGADLTQPAFWRDSVAMAAKTVTTFEGLAAKLGIA